RRGPPDLRPFKLEPSMRCRHGRSIHYSWQECSDCVEEDARDKREWERHDFERRQAEAAEALVKDQRKRAAREDALDGECACHGGTFIERFRTRPKVGKKWTGLLADYAESGVCPDCYNRHGRSGGLERDWTPQEWQLHWERQVAALSTAAAAT